MAAGLLRSSAAIKMALDCKRPVAANQKSNDNPHRAKPRCLLPRAGTTEAHGALAEGPLRRTEKPVNWFSFDAQ